MAKSVQKSIFRYVGDSQPEISTIRVNGVPVPLEYWDVYMYYDEVDSNGVSNVIEITGVPEIKNTGKVKFYPRAKYCKTVAAGTPFTAFTVPGTYEFSIVRKGIGYESDVNGTLVYFGGSYVVYDGGNPDHVGLPKFSEYNEAMTHAVGMIEIGTRLPL